jgi:hypothetical protein
MLAAIRDTSDAMRAAMFWGVPELERDERREAFREN